MTGEAILGPLKGQRLRSFLNDELTFELWKRENPQGRVLRPDEQLMSAAKYAPANWEERMERVPVATSQNMDASLAPRTLVIGLTVNGAAKAYPFAALVKQSPILDTVGGVPLFIVLGEDKRSVRAYERLANGRRLELFVKPDAAPLLLVDAETGSEWDFKGQATRGPLAGQQLKQIAVLSDYWFDWKTYHPQTLLYTLDAL